MNILRYLIYNNQADNIRMNRRGIVIAALNHKETLPIPYHIEFTGQSLEGLIKATGRPNIENEIGTYLHYTQYWGWPTELEGNPEHFKDEFGVVRNRGGVDKDIGVVEDPQIKDLEHSDYQFPQPVLRGCGATLKN
jgi:uroporphyrinogen decarboxylase